MNSSLLPKPIGTSHTSRRERAARSDSRRPRSAASLRRADHGRSRKQCFRSTFRHKRLGRGGSPEIVHQHYREDDMLFALIADDARSGYDNLRPLGNFNCRNVATSESDRTTTDNTAALAHSSPSSDVEVVPEALDLRMRGAPFPLEFSTSSSLNRPGSNFRQAPRPPMIAESEITGLSDAALRRLLIESAVRYAENLASGDAIRLRLAGRAVASKRR